MAEKRPKPSDLLARMGRSLEAAAPITTDHLAEVAAHDGDPAEEARLAGTITTPVERPAPEPAAPVAPVVPEPVLPHDDVVSDAPPLHEPTPPVSDVSVSLETPPFQEPVPPTALPPVRPIASVAAEAEEEPAKPERPEKPKRSRKDKMPRRLPGPKDSVRFSLDLERTRHKEFKTFSLLEAEIDAAVVGRVLVEMMLEDPALKARVLARVAQLKSEYLANGSSG